MEEYLGIIKIFAGTFVPRGWHLCDGSPMSISQNAALYSLLGTAYGGDGVQTFNLPDLMGRVPVGTGSGAGLSPVIAGQKGGVEGVILTAAQMPQHTHASNVNSTIATQANATGGAAIASPGFLEGRVATATLGFNMAAPNTALSQASIGMSGGNLAHNNMQPFLGLMYIICTVGIYPARD